MKLNFSTAIRDLQDQPIIEGGNPLTLGSIACNALLTVHQDEALLPAEEKVKRFRMAQAAVKGGEQDCAVEDVASLKKLIGKLYGPLVVGRVFEIIEGAQ